MSLGRKTWVSWLASSDGTFGEFVRHPFLKDTHLDFLKRKVEANAHSWAGGEGNIGGLVTRLDLLTIPTVGVELGWVVPQLGVVVNVVESDNADRVLGELVAARQDHVDL